MDREGQVYFVVPGQHYIMKIDREGQLTTFVADPRLSLPHHLLIDQDGNIYTSSDNDGVIWMISPDGRMTEYFTSQDLRDAGLGNVGQWGDPFTMNPAGTIYFTSEPRRRSQIYRIDAMDGASLLAGSDEGYADSIGSYARFGNLPFASMACGPDGLLYVTDRTHIRVVAPDGTVSTLELGEGPELEFATGITVGPEGRIYVVDSLGRRLIWLTADSAATTLAGPAGLFGPTGVAVGPAGDIYVLDAETFGTRVLRVSSDGNVTRLASINIQLAIIIMISVLLLVFPLLLVTWMWQRRARSRVDAIVRGVIVGGMVVLSWIAGGALPPSFYLQHVALLRHIVLVLYAVTAVRYVRQAPNPTT